MRPIAVVLKFIPGQPPSAHLSLYFPGHTRVVGDEIEPAFLISLMLTDDLSASFIRRLRVIVAVTDVVRAHRPVIVGVGLAIGDAVEFLKCLAPAGVEDPNEQFILFWIITGRFGKWDPIVGMIGQAHAKAIGLHFLVALPIFARRLG